MPTALRRVSSRHLRTLATAGAAVIAATSLAGCGSDPGGGEKLQVWVYQDGSTTIQEEAVERFNEESEVDIELVPVPGENYQDRMRTAMGSGKNAPDIFFNWGGGSISDFVAEDMLVDLTPYLDEDKAFRDAFVPSILGAGEIDGKNYGIPMRGVQPVILFYNKTLFDEVGAEPPQTLDDMFGLIDTFKQAGKTPAVVAGADAWTELMWLEYLLDREGGAEVFERIQNGDQEAWGDPAVLTMAENAKKLVDEGMFGNNFGSVSYTNDGASTVFAQGDAAMHLMGSWEYANQLANQPEFAANDLAYATFPTIEGGAGDPSAVVGNPTNYWSVNSKLEKEGEEDRLAAAIEFLKSMGSEDYTRALIENGDIPPTSNAAQFLEDHADPEFAQWEYDMITNASSFQLSWDQAVPASQSEPMINAIEELFGGQISPQEFVDKMKNL